MSPVGVAVLMSLLIWASCTDLVGRKIPNRIFVAGMLFGVVAAANQGWLGIASAMGGCILGMAFVLPFYLVRGMAAGDVKLMGVVGMFVGAQAILPAVVYVFAAGGVMAAGWWAVSRLRGHGAAIVPAEHDKARGHGGGVAHTKLPYALAIAAGVGTFLFT